MVPHWAHAIGARSNIARRAVVARNIALFIRSSLSCHVSLATSTSKHATQRTLAPLYAGLFTHLRGETVWKIGIGPEIGTPKVTKRGPWDPDQPLPGADEARPRGPRLFSKQFLHALR